MQEYYTQAISLRKEPIGEVDIQVSLFTKRFGKLIARGKSARKITSKLSAHLEPGNVVLVRLIEKNGLQIADALKVSRLLITPSDLHFLDSILAEGSTEFSVWQHLTTEVFSWASILSFLGWDQRNAVCYTCQGKNPDYFFIKAQDFFCRTCKNKASQTIQNEVLCINDGSTTLSVGIT